MKTILKQEIYKNRKITLYLDDYNNELAIIEGDETMLYASISDCKRVINGKQPLYTIE